MVSFEFLCESFSKLTNEPDKFLSAGHLTGDIKSLLKYVYDFCQNQNKEGSSIKALPELIIKDFDDEQIWQELELQNETSLPTLINKAARLLVSKKLTFPVKTGGEDSPENVKPKKEVKEDKVERSEAISSDEESEELLEDDRFSDSGSDKISTENNVVKKVKIFPSEVDDNFFKLSEMEAFLKDQEEGEKDLGVDLFDQMLSDSEDEEERPMYRDFFDGQREEDIPNFYEKGESDGGPDGDLYHGDKPDSPLEATEKKVKFNFQDDSESDFSDGDSKVKSSFEIREEKLRKKIAELEDEAMEEKAWPLKGEVNADNRPVNSLLEEVVEFDMTQRPAPIVTEETTSRLEDIIKQRIRDQAYDDVERKVKPVSTPYEFKKKLVLDQEKSKQSLAEIYEQEYLKQKDDQNNSSIDKPDVEPEEHQIIRNMMKSLFNKLDALSNFFFVPKPVAPDLKIISNAPAIDIEEVAPVVASDAKLLAPEEVGGSFRKSLVAREEKTKTDKKRERRKKKVHQARKFKEKAIQDANKPVSYDQQMKKVMKFKNVSKLEEKSTKSTKSSKDFFSKLQDDVQNPEREHPHKRKSKQFSKNAKKLKL